MTCTSSIKVICCGLIVTLLWLSGPYRALAADYHAARSRPRPAAAPLQGAEEPIRFDDILLELKALLEEREAQTDTESGLAEIDQLLDLRTRLEVEHKKVQAYFDQLATFIREKDLSDEIVARQQVFERDYQTKYKQLLAHLDQIETAHRQTTSFWARLSGQNNGAKWETILKETDAFLAANTPQPRESHFDPHNLPHRSLRAEEPILPKLTAAEWRHAFPELMAASGKSAGLAYPITDGPTTASTAFAPDPPMPEDLAETIEVQFTPDITQLAADLDHNPVQIFNWVRNNIEFVPTWGSIQGAQLCLETRACNAFDTASLLIALFRVSGVPARYQMGTIEVPVEQFMNWAGGFTDPDTAASLFASGGVPSVVQRVDESGEVVTVKLEHVWVKAFVDYVPSRGGVNIEGDTWVAMAPSFKQYNFPDPVDLSQFISENLADPISFRDQLLATADVDPATGGIANLDTNLIQTTFEPDEEGALDFFINNFPDRSIAEIIGRKAIEIRELSILPTKFPCKILIDTLEFDTIPDNLRHSLEISITDINGNPVLSLEKALPELSSAQIILGYEPASQADEEALEAILLSDPEGEFPISIPTSFINMTPQLKVGSQVVITGNAVRLGANHQLEIHFTAPTIETPALMNVITVGEIFAIAVDLQRLSPITSATIVERLEQIADEVDTNPTDPDISPVEIQELLLKAIIASWFSQVDFVSELFADQSGVVSLRYPSLGMVFADFISTNLFGVPSEITSNGVTMDIDRDIVVTLAKDGDSQVSVNHTLMTGIIGSKLEADLPSQFIFHLDQHPNAYWMATTSALAIATDLGDTLVALTPDNFPLVASQLAFSTSDLENVENALNAGLTVFIHQSLLGDQAGTPFLGLILLDPLTGSGTFLIGGSGGSVGARCSTAGDFTDFGLLGDLFKGGVYGTGKNIVSSYVSKWGGPGKLVDNILTIVNIASSFASNASKAEEQFGEVEDSLKPLLGLAILFAALDILKEISGVGGAAGEAIGVYLNIASWTAYTMASQIVGRIAEIEAINHGIQLTPGCLAKL